MGIGTSRHLRLVPECLSLKRGGEEPLRVTFMGVPAECIPVDRILLHINQLTHAVGTILGRAGGGGIQ